MGLPAWMPWPGVMKAHIGRYNAGQALDDFQRALDALANGEAVDSSWGEPDDVSDFIMERHAIYKSNSCKPPLKLNGSPMLALDNGFEFNERGDISVVTLSLHNSSHNGSLFSDLVGFCCQRKSSGLLANSVHSFYNRTGRPHPRRSRPLRNSHQTSFDWQYLRSSRA
jgi:hypothetical protein